jgi:hypothetical protein
MFKSLEEVTSEINSFSGVRFSIEEFVQKVDKFQNHLVSSLENNTSLLASWRRSTPGPIKWFKEELTVIRRFLTKHGKEVDFITAINGSQSYDAIWETSGKSIFLEVTFAKDGHLERRRADHMDKYGHAPLTLEDPGEIKNDKSLSKNYFPDATDVPEAIKKECNMINEWIQAKQSSEQYSDGTYFLLVGYAPDLPGRFNEVKEKFNLEKLSSTFEKIYVVHPFEESFFEAR